MESNDNSEVMEGGNLAGDRRRLAEAAVYASRRARAASGSMRGGKSTGSPGTATTRARGRGWARGGNPAGVRRRLAEAAVYASRRARAKKGSMRGGNLAGDRRRLAEAAVYASRRARRASGSMRGGNPAGDRSRAASRLVFASRRARRASGSKGGGKKGTPWTRFVKKIHDQLKKKNPGAMLGDAMKAASKRKDEM